MLPYVVNLALWILVAIGLPAIQTLHSLQIKTDDRKTWLFYWVAYVAASWFLFYFDWLLRIPFFVLAFYLDVYFEVQILVVSYLVLPGLMGIRHVQEAVEKNGGKAGELLLEQVQLWAKLARQALLGLQGPAQGNAPAQ